jgi:hypothetical protein
MNRKMAMEKTANRIVIESGIRIWENVNPLLNFNMIAVVKKDSRNISISKINR